MAGADPNTPDTPPIAVPPSDRATKTKALVGGVLGNLVEFHDFAIYGLLTGVMSRTFFPEGDPAVALLAAFLVYASSFAVRPLGGIVLGRLGDRWGRLRLLALTIIGMSVATGAMALLPTYAMIGPAATVLLVLCRLTQGFFVGGEFASATSYIVEHGTPRWRAFRATFSSAAAYVGTAFGLGLYTLFTAVIPTAAFESWGWRLLVAVAIPMGLVGAFIRYRLEESPEFLAVAAARERAGTVAPGTIEVVRTQWKKLLTYISILMSHTLPNYLVIGFFATYLTQFVGMSALDAGIAVLVSQLTLIVTTLSAGAINDLIGRRRTLIIGCCMLVPGIFLAMSLARVGTLTTAILAMMILVASYPLISSGMVVGLVEMFPTGMRVTAGSIAYNVGTSLFGGTAPLVATWLMQRTGTPFSVAGYVAVMAVLSLLSVVFFFNRSQRQSQREPAATLQPAEV